MFSHITVGVSDFDRAFGFWQPLMALLGHPVRLVDRSRPWAVWETAGGGRPFFIITRPFDGAPALPGNGTMAAFSAGDRTTVERVHELGLALGGHDEGGPALRPEYHPGYYGAYLRDPDGNKLCIVCHAPQGC